MLNESFTWIALGPDIATDSVDTLRVGGQRFDGADHIVDVDVDVVVHLENKASVSAEGPRPLQQQDRFERQFRIAVLERRLHEVVVLFLLGHETLHRFGIFGQSDEEDDARPSEPKVVRLQHLTAPRFAHHFAPLEMIRRRDDDHHERGIHHGRVALPGAVHRVLEREHVVDDIAQVRLQRRHVLERFQPQALDRVLRVAVFAFQLKLPLIEQ